MLGQRHFLLCAAVGFVMMVGNNGTADENFISPIKVIGDTRFRGDRRPLVLLQSEDEKTIETVVNDGSRIVWDVESKTVLRTIEPKGNWYIRSAYSLADPSKYLIYGFSHDKSKMLSEGLYRIDRKSGVATFLTGGLSSYPAVSTGGNYVVFPTKAKKWEVRSIDDGSLVQSIPAKQLGASGASASGTLVLSDKGDFMVECFEEKKSDHLRCWKIGEDQPVWERVVGRSGLWDHCLIVRPGSNQAIILNGIFGTVAECFDIPTGQIWWKTRIDKFSDRAAWTPDGTKFLVERDDDEGGAQLLDGDTGKELGQIRHFPGTTITRISHNYFSLNNYLVCLYDSNFNRVYPRAEDCPLVSGDINCNARVLGERYIIPWIRIKLGDGLIEPWKVPEGENYHDLAISPGGKFLAFYNTDSEYSLYIVESKTQKVLRRIPRKTVGEIKGFQFSRSGKYIFTLSFQPNLQLHQFALDDEDEDRNLPLPPLKEISVDKRPFIYTNSDLRLIGIINGSAYLWNLGKEPNCTLITKNVSYGGARTGEKSDIYAFQSSLHLELWNIESTYGSLSPAQTGAYLQDLGHPDFGKRQLATQLLIQTGLSLDLGALEKLNLDDPEVADRANLIRTSIAKNYTPSKLITITDKSGGGRVLVDNSSDIPGLIFAEDHPQGSNFPSTIITLNRLKNKRIIDTVRFSSGALCKSMAVGRDNKLYALRVNGLFDVYDLNPKP